jgi:WD40 repeat protein
VTVQTPLSYGTFLGKACWRHFVLTCLLVGKRCFRPRIEELNISERLEVKVCMPFTFSGDECFAFSGDERYTFLKTKREAGIYNGVECSFSSKAVDYTLSVIERTHLSTLAAWNLFDDDICRKYRLNSHKLTAIEDDLWFYADAERLFVFRTLAPIHQQSSRLARATRVLSSSFSPDGSRLATCTSDGYINIWNVHTGKVEQRFKSNQGDSSFACWWSEKFLFVFDFFDRIPSVSKYPVDVNLKILFLQSQQVSLCHLLEEFVSLSAIVDFSEGLLSFECGKTEPVKVLDVSGVGGPRMVTLPGIEPEMSITVSPGASFVVGIYKSLYCIWKRNAKEELDVYEALWREVVLSKRCKTTDTLYKPCKTTTYPQDTIECVCSCFSKDSKVAVVVVDEMIRDIAIDPGATSRCFEAHYVKIFDLVTHDHKSVEFDFRVKIGMSDLRTKLFCLNKDRVLIAAHRRFLEFFDMDSGAHLGSSMQRHLTWDSGKQLQLSPKETKMAFPKINGDMEFLRLCIPQSSELSSMKREAAAEWRFAP